ncbi:hypothetical protein SAMN05216207_105510 [Pseudonocardia ammonioxydans]|uniref:SCP2 domain-containing protein n=1 Tax=Pseudonocardia ammonioxydans TaxID=260086 RepID=A0A1I5H1L1_PSUAM|nr:hypothetical protein [Pseudonocardia ammonioxydans]SFO42097.1 hypothetical protein SAMN05216207_105510 [Pseudonocardia ammonioxydans]
MSRFEDESFLTTWIEAVNADPAFTEATRWFDGSILLDDDGAQAWLKVYDGAVIDRKPFMPPFGYTFKISAPRWAWNELPTGTKFTDLLLGGKRRYSGPEDLTGTPNLVPGAFVIEGDTMSAYRIIQAIYLMTDHYSAAARSSERAA